MTTYLDEPVQLKIGDWVRFYKDGRLIVSEIRYVVAKWDTEYYVTDDGEVSKELIIDYRRKR